MRPRTLAVAAVGALLGVALTAAACEPRPAAAGEPPLSGRAVPAPVTIRGGGEADDASVRERPVTTPRIGRLGPRTAARSGAGWHAGRGSGDAGPGSGDAGPGSAEDELDTGQRAALREAGWAVPAKLAGSWVLRRARVVSEGDDRPGVLQLVYTRSDETVSVFQRAAPLSWARVPDGGAAVPELAGSVREWPHARPRRLMWEADGRTFVVVGDVDRDELVEVAAALPEAEVESVWHRVRRGFETLVGRLSR